MNQNYSSSNYCTNKFFKEKNNKNAILMFLVNISQKHIYKIY